ncbi:MAG: hypothetical protein ACE5D7_08610 [Fidelibacterota bacterium]
MKKFAEIIPFVLIIIGTAGLLLTEFWFDWGKGSGIGFCRLQHCGIIVESTICLEY